MGVAVTADDLLLVRHGVTTGLKLVLWRSALSTAVVGALTVATYLAVRGGDREPALRRAAWVFAALTAGIVAFNIAR